MDIDDRRFVNPGNEDYVYPDAPGLRHTGGHETVPVAVQGHVAGIDKEIAELVYLLWSCGIETESSCQDLYEFHQRVAEMHGAEPYSGPRPGQLAYIEFATMEDIAAFMTIVAPEDGVPGSLWDRSTGGNLDTDADGVWEWAFWPKMEGRRPKLGAGAEFPIADLALLLPPLREAAAKIPKY